MTLTRRRRPALVLVGLALGAGLLTPATILGGAAGAAPDVAGPDEQPKVAAPVVQMITTNIDFGPSAAKQRNQVQFVLKSQPEIVTLQEVRELNLRKPGGPVTNLGKYGVVQAWSPDTPYKRASAILYRTSRFRLIDSGFAVGYQNRDGVDPPTRYLPWAVLKDRATKRTIAVVSVHMPKASLKNAKFGAAYRAMLSSYETLVKGLRARGAAVLTGGDWNQSVRTGNPKIRWDPMDGNRRAGLRFNWKKDKPCNGTHGKGSFIDGIAFRVPATTLLAQGCLDKHNSDHRPVFVNFQLTASTDL